MTQVVSAKTHKADVTLVVGQIWQNANGDYLTVNTLELLPDMNIMGNNTRITVTDHNGNESKGSFIEFLSQKIHLVKDIDIDSLGGLHGHHLLEPFTSIAVGQVWEHYKGDKYVITSVALDADVGVDDFNLARIGYRPLQSGQTYEWSLTVADFLKVTDTGVKRFTPVALTGKDKRKVLPERSLRYFWRISA